MSSRSLSPPKGAIPLVKLFADEEDKTQEALKTFKCLDECQYANKRLGNAKHNEFMECDCYEEFEDGTNRACDENSDCINRLTLIECVNGLCGSCGDDCQNQRFQKREYADIAVFQTKLKGYGVRAEADIESQQFIYEYMGEVIPEDAFRDRLIAYDEKGYKHFYFMMLQNGEFIDATVKGSLARFCNHSCNPNAYVNKWVVAGKLKMGIFANRKILKGEEITFDYNVDRYGATAQRCFCGEPNCIGFLGGKTQTDAASLLPQNMAEALAVSVSMEKQWIKMKKSEGQKVVKSEGNNINVEFVESLDPPPCERPEDVTKVMSVLLQVEDKLLAKKLLQRLFDIEDDTSLHHQIIKLHGYTCFGKLLQIFRDVLEMEAKLIDFLLMLPKTTKNGIITSHIDKEVEQIKQLHNALAEPCDKLLGKWSDFETYKRITKKDIKEASNRMVDLRRIRLPPGWEIVHENGKPMYYNAQLKTKLHQPPSGSSKTFNTRRQPTNSNANKSSMKRSRLDDGEYERQKLRRLEKEKEAIEKVKEEETRALKLRLEMENQKKSELEKIIAEANKLKDIEREQQAQLQKENEEKRLKKKNNHVEHKWNKFFASFVPSLLRKYEQQDALSHEHAKQCARDIVKILTSKELKKDGARAPPEEPSKDKRTKVKQFTASYMSKFLLKYRKKHTGRS
ncbi:probable Histone-lysine N-methyltransferase, H3 lysine-36 specific [Zygosaccharomyces bailii ISA1307]|nr:probable Histone-lysine N-methyltransferase, H3 lysine-36 specific [Zygosaccharomyces bailii ISA1307]